MKKIFKAISVLAATAALGTGVALASGCSAGYNGEYIGEYHYKSAYGTDSYGVRVKVYVENNIITKVEDITNLDKSAQNGYKEDENGNVVEDLNGGYEWTTVSPGWETYRNFPWVNQPDVDEAPDWYAWTDANANNWSNNEAYLLQLYEGWAVSDILDIKVFIKSSGEPYEVAGTVNHNPQMNESGLLISGSTQGSGRLMLAIQNALGK